MVMLPGSGQPVLRGVLTRPWFRDLPQSRRKFLPVVPGFVKLPDAIGRALPLNDCMYRDGLVWHLGLYHFLR
jgi:hypothetical protein